MALRHKVSPISGNMNTNVAGTVVGGAQVFMGNVARKIGALFAIVNVTAATSTLTIAGKWQGSVDGSTWIDCKPSNNAASVVLATGTSAATGDIAIEAPSSVNAFRYVRYALVNGVATGGTSDVYAISYTYRQLAGRASLS